MNALITLCRRDLLLAMRRKSEVLSGVFFFIVLASLFQTISMNLELIWRI